MALWRTVRHRLNITVIGIVRTAVADGDKVPDNRLSDIADYLLSCARTDGMDVAVFWKPTWP